MEGGAYMDIVLSRILKYLNGCLDDDHMYRIGLFIVHHYVEMEDYSLQRVMEEGHFSDLIDESEEDVIFDFQNTSFIDSSGIGLVLGRYNQLKFEHRTLILTGLNPVAYRLFELTGMFQIMPYYESIENLKEGTL